MLLVFALLLWLPFGFGTGVTGDSWIYFMQVAEGNPFASASATRIFLPVVWVITDVVAPGSFYGMNIVALLLIAGKSWILFLILRELTKHASFAFGAAVIYLCMPVDTGIFYLGALAIHFVVFCYLLALVLLLRYWVTRRLWLIVPMVIAQLVASGIYEPIYPFVVLTPLILLARERRLSARVVRTSILWVLTPGLYAVWYLAIMLIFPRAAQYQTDLVQMDRSLGAMLASLVNIYRRHFIDGWATSVENLSYVFLALIGALIAFLIARSLWQSAPPLRSFRWIGVGLVIISVGVVLYLPTALRDDVLRTFYFSGIGAALVIAAAVNLVSRGRPVIFAGLVACVVGLGVLGLLNQHHGVVELSERQQRMFTAFASLLPGVQPGTGIVIIDRTADQQLSALLGAPMYAEYIVPALYGDYSIRAVLCTAAEVGTHDGARCRFGADRFTAYSLRSFWMETPYPALVVVDYDERGFVIAPSIPVVGAYVPEQRMVTGENEHVRRLFANP